MLCDSCAALSMEPGAWSVSCAYWWSFVLISGLPCPLCSLAMLRAWSFLRVTHKTIAARVPGHFVSRHAYGECPPPELPFPGTCRVCSSRLGGGATHCLSVYFAALPRMYWSTLACILFPPLFHEVAVLGLVVAFLQGVSGCG